MAGLDANTGKVVWQVPFACNGVIQTPERLRALSPSCGVYGTLYLLESESQSKNGIQNPHIAYTLKSFDPRTGKLLSEHPLGSDQGAPGVGNYQGRPSVIGASNGLLYATIGIPREANTIPYSDIVFVAYHLNDGTQAWQHAMPPFPAPQGANTSPHTSGAMLFPSEH